MESVSNSVNYGNVNYFTDKIMYGAVYENAELGDSPDGKKSIILHAGGSIKFSIPEQDMKSDSKYLKTIIRFEETPATASNYNSPIFAEFRVGYGNSDVIDSSFVVVNRDVNISESNSESVQTDGIVLYENESVVENRGQYILTLDCAVFNNSEEDFIIRGIELYLSADASVYQIARVLKEEVISADVIQATANFSDAMFTQFLRTNVFSMDAFRNVGGGTVNYLTAEDWSLGFYTTELSSTETEQFSIDVTVGGKTETVYFWYAIIGDSEDSYRYITTIDPRTKYPNISDFDRDKFKMLVWKSESTTKKLSIEFATVSDGKGGKTTAPVFLLGAGSSSDPNSLNGKGSIYKDGNGMYLKYTTQNGVDIGLIMDESGIYLKGVQNALEWCDEYDNGFNVKFKGDNAFFLEEKRDEANKFLGFEVQGVLIPFGRKSGNYSA